MPAKKSPTKKPTDEQSVSDYLDALIHPSKDLIEEVRKVILSNKLLSERIKWNAPSYHKDGVDLVTFNFLKGRVMLVFHHIAIVSIESDILEGTYKDRRLVTLTDMPDFIGKKKELQRVVDAVVAMI